MKARTKSNADNISETHCCGFKAGTSLMSQIIHIIYSQVL